MKVGSCCWLLGLERSWWMLLPVRVPGLGPSPVRCRPSPAGAWVKGHEAIAQATEDPLDRPVEAPRAHSGGVESS